MWRISIMFIILAHSEGFRARFEHYEPPSWVYHDYDFDDEADSFNLYESNTLLISHISSADEIKNRLSENTQSVTVNNSKIDTISKSLFEESKNLKVVKFENVQISTVENGTFDDLPLLTEVQFYNTSLKTLPNNLFKPLKKLESLDLRYNQLKKFEPELLAGLTKFKNLYISHNYLTKIDKNLFKDFENLTTVDLSHNNLTELDDGMLSSTDQLDCLYLNRNELKNFPNISHVKSRFNSLAMQENNLTELNFGKLPIVSRYRKLKLRFAHNKIKTIIYTEESTKTEIFLLDLNYNALTEFPKISSVEILYLSNNNIYKFESNDLTNMTRLRDLDVSSNYISYIPTGIFLDTQNLESLNMSHNQLQHFEVGSLYGLDNVKSLDLSYNKLQSIPEKHFIISVNKLESLYLNNNNIIYLDPLIMQDTHLNRLDIDKNSLSCTNLLEMFHSLRTSSSYRYYPYRNRYITKGKTFNSSNVQGITCVDDSKNTIPNKNFTDTDIQVPDSFFYKLTNVMKTIHSDHDEWLKNISISFHKVWENLKSDNVAPQPLINSKTSKENIVSNTGTNLLLGFILCCLIMLVIIFGIQSWRTRRNGFGLVSRFDNSVGQINLIEH